MTDSDAITAEAIEIIKPGCKARIQVRARLAIGCNLGDGHDGMHQITIQWRDEVCDLATFEELVRVARQEESRA